METSGTSPIGGERSFLVWFARHSWRRFAFVSAVLLIPVFWHRRIEAGDLPSHLYNTWLAQLIRQGKGAGIVDCAAMEQCPL